MPQLAVLAEAVLRAYARAERRYQRARDARLLAETRATFASVRDKAGAALARTKASPRLDAMLGCLDAMTRLEATVRAAGAEVLQRASASPAVANDVGELVVLWQTELRALDADGAMDLGALRLFLAATLKAYERHAKLRWLPVAPRLSRRDRAASRKDFVRFYEAMTRELARAVGRERALVGDDLARALRGA
jgi:hypothetical protein